MASQAGTAPQTGGQNKKTPGKAPGKKYAGLSRNEWFIVGGVFAAALGYVLWKRHQAAAAAASSATTNAGSNECTDANGNPVDCGEETAEELAALQNQLDQLQGSGSGSSGGGGSYWGGGTGTTTGTGTGTGTPTSPTTPVTPTAPANPTSPAYPMNQTGTVHSATTGGTGKVDTTDGGFTWHYDGVPAAKGAPLNQTGTVTSATTGRQGAVKSGDAGKTWTYVGVPSSG